MSKTTVALRFPGDAFVSYGALKRAGEAQAKGASLPAVLTLFAIVEAVGATNGCGFAPFADARLDQVARLPAWTMLHGQSLIAPIDAALVADNARAGAGAARETWRRQVRALGAGPGLRAHRARKTSRQHLPPRAQRVAWAYYAASESVDVMTADGLARWQRHVAGIGFDARAEAANDGDDDYRFMNWETTSVYLARAATIDALAGRLRRRCRSKRRSTPGLRVRP